MTRRAERRASRREEVLVAAMRLVAEEGLDALTIQRIAGAIGASVGGLYRYYDGKDALLGALQQRAIAAVADDQAADVANARKLFARTLDGTRSGVASLATALVASTVVLRHAHRRPEEHKLLDAFLSAHESILTDESARTADDALRPLVDAVAHEIVAAAEGGVIEPGDAVQRTYLLWAALHGLDHFRKRDRILAPALRVEQLVPATLVTICRGWGASSAEAQRAVSLHESFEREDAGRAS
jgi:AcrR family transcriptional regulator